MIEREKKRIRLEKKYALKRTNLLTDYKQEENFTKNLRFIRKFNSYQGIVQKRVFVIVVGKRAVHVEFSVILVFLVTFYVKWHISVYYQVLQNLVGKKTYMDFYKFHL